MLNDKFCKNVSPPSSGSKLYRDGKTKGLALRVTAAGSRSFVFCYMSPIGRERRKTIGSIEVWSLTAARKEAKDLRRCVDRGDDPFAIRDKQSQGLKLGELWSWYAENELYRLGARTRENVTNAFEKQILPLIGKWTLIETLQRSDVQRLIDRVSERNGPVAANRMHSHFRRALNLAMAAGMIEENPAAGPLRRNHETHRERYLDNAEIERLVQVLAAHRARDAADAILLLLLTGARKTEVLSMEWQHIDLDSGRWLKPAERTKQRRLHVVPLSGHARDLLLARRDKASSRFVFPGRESGAHRTSIKKVWEEVRELAGLGNCRIHDLRHTFASMAVSQGCSLEAIGALLGHSQTSTTQRYAHLHDEPLRRMVENIGDAFSGTSKSGSLPDDRE